MSFDPESFDFLEVVGANDTRRIPVPEYPDGVMLICKDTHKPKQFTMKDSGETRWVAELVFIVDHDLAREATGMKEPTIRMPIWLDINEQGLDMGKGKNVDLGRAREAMGLNDPQRPFKFSDFKGRMCKGVVKHTEQADKNKPNYGEKYANITKIVAASAAVK